MKGFLKILFYDYSNIVIPHNVIDNQKILILNNAHALMCDDYKFYDDCLKITYDFDSNEFTFRDENLIRKKLNMPDLEAFLLNEIKKYSLPCDSIIDIPKLKNIQIVNYYLPNEQEVFSDMHKLQEIILNTHQVMSCSFNENIYKSIITYYRKIFENSLNTIKEYQNISRKTRYTFVSSILCPLTNFLLYEKNLEKMFKLTDGTYFIELICRK